MFNENAMNEAIRESEFNKLNGYTMGGPFGASIVKDGKIISVAHNTVIETHDPTAHGEVNAIRKACQALGTHDLSECVLYTSAEPCPMCLSAIIWANIKEVYFANTRKDTADIGFKDDDIYEFIKGNNEMIKIAHIENKEAKRIFDEFKEMNSKKMY